MLAVVFTSLIIVVYDCTKVQKVVDLHACASSNYILISGMAFFIHSSSRNIFPNNYLQIFEM